MIWLALVVAGFAFVQVKVGALSVWVGVLSLGLKAALLALAGPATWFLWTMLRGRKG